MFRQFFFKALDILFETEFQGHSDILCSFGLDHWDKDELNQCQIYHSMERNIALINN